MISICKRGIKIDCHILQKIGGQTLNVHLTSSETFRTCYTYWSSVKSREQKTWALFWRRSLEQFYMTAQQTTATFKTIPICSAYHSVKLLFGPGLDSDTLNQACPYICSQLGMGWSQTTPLTSSICWVTLSNLWIFPAEATGITQHGILLHCHAQPSYNVWISTHRIHEH